jgi:hypothetical protein
MKFAAGCGSEKLKHCTDNRTEGDETVLRVPDNYKYASVMWDGT